MKNIQYYVCGHTAGGSVNYLHSNLKKLGRIIILKHPSKVLKTTLLKHVINHYEGNSDVEIICSAVRKQYLDGIIIRERSLAIICNEIVTHEIKNAHIFDMNDFVKERITKEAYQRARAKREHLLNAAFKYFAEGLRIHDELEHIYINQMNFQKADKLASDFIVRLLGAIPKQKRHPTIKRRLFGTNTIDGSTNQLPHLIDSLEIRTFIKGRAGTGKSVFMKKVLQACLDHGFDCEVYHCSFDPKSVDMIIVRDLNFCIFDSTPPHELQPTRQSDIVVDLYEHTVDQGTDERFAEEIALVTSRYQAEMKKGRKKLREIIPIEEQLERNDHKNPPKPLINTLLKIVSLK